MMVRDHECFACGKKWASEVRLSPHTPNLSGERTERCPQCGKPAGMSSPAREVRETRAIMILARDGNQLLQAPLRYVPLYHVVTWSTYEPAEMGGALLKATLSTIQHGPMSKGGWVFAVWTAPFDQTRFTVPMWIEEAAAAAGVYIRR